MFIVRFRIRMGLMEQADFFENTLVRFRSTSTNNIEALKDNKLYYSIPQNFNDPYDTLIYANYLKIIQDIYINIEIGMDSYLEKLKKSTIPNAKFLAEYGCAIWNSPNKNKIVESFLEEIFEITKKLKETIRKNVKIICFSESYYSMLMWSHYADNHKGFAIIYDRNDIENAENYSNQGILIRKKPILKRVLYATEQSDLTYEIEEYVRAYRMTNLGDVVPPTPNLSQDKLRKMVTEKSPDWSYEKEWRVIPKHISLENESSLGYMCIKPKGIILGSMCSEKDQSEIINICDREKIPVFKAELNYWEPGYKLEIMKLENDFYKSKYYNQN